MVYDRSFFDEPLNRRGTDSEKWDDEAACPQGALPMWVADMDFRCAKPITDAVLARAQHPCFGYSAENSADSASLCGFWQRRHGLDLAPENTHMIPCVVTGLRAAVDAFTAPGDGVILCSPVYRPFFASIEEIGRRVMDCPLLSDENARYSMDFPAIEDALRHGGRLFMLCNPHNPVSRLWSRSELERLVSLIKQYNAVIVSDEIHADFVYQPGVFTPILALPEAHDCAVALLSASKTFNIAGLQQAEAASMSKELLDAIKKTTHIHGATSGNIFALCATRAAYTACDDWLDGLIAYLDDNRRLLSETIAKTMPKAILTPIEATYLAWLDLRAYAPTCTELMEKMKAHGVILTGGEFFGAATGQGFMRLNFGCPRAQLEEALRRIAAAVNE